MVLEHAKDNKHFRGYITADDGGGEDEIAVEFRLGEENNVTAVRFDWEPEWGASIFFGMKESLRRQNRYVHK